MCFLSVTLQLIMLNAVVMRGFRVFYLFSAFALLIGCEMPGSKESESPGSTYLDYKIWGEEYDGEVTVLLQFREGGMYGNTRLLHPPAEVLLDGKALPADSSRMTGAFYETRSTIDDFQGTHQIVFRDSDGREYTESFQFARITLKNELPQQVERNDLLLEMEGLAEVDYVRLLLTDTAFDSEGINRLDTVRNGRMLISKQDFARLVSGPVHMELIRDLEKTVKERPEAGGKIAISYGLSREFVLVDSLLP